MKPGRRSKKNPIANLCVLRGVQGKTRRNRRNKTLLGGQQVGTANQESRVLEFSLALTLIRNAGDEGRKAINDKLT
jgi:hypothetical protein